MKIGLITLSRIETNQNKYYNAQDLGLAKALSGKGNQVLIYRLTKDVTKIEQEGEIQIKYHKVNGLGKQSLCKFKFLDAELDRLICFSDNQISFSTLCKWCNQKTVLLMPYVGVLQSNSSNKLIQLITNALVNRNIKRYRMMKVYGKTPDVLQQLASKKVEETTLVPVCLNEDLLKKNYEKYNKIELRQKYGYGKEDNILFFIGRLDVEKEPVEMIEVLANVRKKDGSWKLLMVGKGPLEEEVHRRIQRLYLHEYVKWIPQISNQEVWELYCLCDCFVNLNRHEIYGMSILEALYYRCPVIAMNAPGPAYILKDGEMGDLCEEIEKLENEILKMQGSSRKVDTKKYLEEQLSWKTICNQFLE